MDNPNKIPSPCIHVCVRNQDDLCIGCYRTVEEIRAWWKYSDDEKLQVIQNAKQRKLDQDKDNEHAHYA